MASRKVVAAAAIAALIGAALAYLFLPAAPVARRVGDGRAALVDPLASQYPNPGLVKSLAELFGAVGMELDYYPGDQVTVDFMKDFPAGYRVVIFRVHSATSTHGVFYFTAEPYRDDKYLLEQFAGELRPARDLRGGGPYFAFGPRFVERYLAGRLKGALVIGLGCFSAGLSFSAEEDVRIREARAYADGRPNLAHAFVKAGATALVGYDRLISVEHLDKLAIRLVKALTVERLSIKQAVDVANHEVGGDPTYGGKLLYFPSENGGWVLLKSSGRVASMVVPNNMDEARRWPSAMKTHVDEFVAS